MHFCVWFTPFFVCSHACENISGGFLLPLFSLAVYSSPSPTCWVMLRIFPCDSIQSSRFAWFHRMLRNFLDGNRIPFGDEISQDVWYQQKQQMLTESVIQFGGKSAGSSKLIIERFFSDSSSFHYVEPLIAFSAFEMHIRAK